MAGSALPAPSSASGEHARLPRWSRRRRPLSEHDHYFTPHQQQQHLQPPPSSTSSSAASSPTPSRRPSFTAVTASIAEMLGGNNGSATSSDAHHRTSPGIDWQAPTAHRDASSAGLTVSIEQARRANGLVAEQWASQSRSAPTSPRLLLHSPSAVLPPADHDARASAQFAHRCTQMRRVKRGSTYYSAAGFSDDGHGALSPDLTPRQQFPTQSLRDRHVSPNGRQHLVSSLTATPEASDGEDEAEAVEFIAEHDHIRGASSMRSGGHGDAFRTHHHQQYHLTRRASGSASAHTQMRAGTSSPSSVGPYRLSPPTHVGATSQGQAQSVLSPSSSMSFNHSLSSGHSSSASQSGSGCFSTSTNDSSINTSEGNHNATSAATTPEASIHDQPSEHLKEPKLAQVLQSPPRITSPTVDVTVPTPLASALRRSSRRPSSASGPGERLYNALNASNDRSAPALSPAHLLVTNTVPRSQRRVSFDVGTREWDGRGNLTVAVHGAVRSDTAAALGLDHRRPDSKSPSHSKSSPASAQPNDGIVSNTYADRPRLGSRSALGSRRSSTQAVDDLFVPSLSRDRTHAVERSHVSSRSPRTGTAGPRPRLAADDEDIDAVYGASSVSTSGPNSPLATAAAVGANAGTRVKAFLAGLNSAEDSSLRYSTVPSSSLSPPHPDDPHTRPGIISQWSPTPKWSINSNQGSAVLGLHHTTSRRRPSTASGAETQSWNGHQASTPAPPSQHRRNTRQSTLYGASREVIEYTYESLYGTQHHVVKVGNAALASAQLMSEEALMRTMSVAQMQLASATNLALTLTRQLSEPLRPLFHVAIVIGISSFAVISLVAFMTIGYGLSIWDDVSRRAGSLAAASAANPGAALLRQRARQNVEASVRWGRKMLAGTLEGAFSLAAGTAPLDESINRAGAAALPTSSPSLDGASHQQAGPPGAAGLARGGAAFSRAASGTRRSRTSSSNPHMSWASLHAAGRSAPSASPNRSPHRDASSPGGKASDANARSDEYPFHDEPTPAPPSSGFPPRPPLSVLIPSIMLTLLIALGAALVRLFIWHQNEKAVKTGSQRTDKASKRRPASSRRSGSASNGNTWTTGKAAAATADWERDAVPSKR